MRVKVVLCAEWSGIVRESLLLRVEVVAQVLESAAEEMLTAAGKSHCQEGGREGELFVQERALNSQSTRQQQGSKRMIQLCTRDRMKTSEEAFQPAGVIFTAIHGRSTTGLHWPYMSWQS
ncbi:hypothetical protein NQZ68_029019 [Dissostichus eleginoides]|nr:hypothetical protein NQZ68_029019 [Dissostichus eleginoides]